MNPVMNDTKWEELRLAMYNLGALSPRWRTKDLSGHISQWDAEWFYHFRNGGYVSIEWVEIQVSSVEQDAAVVASLKAIHLPGQRIERGFRIYGYTSDGVTVAYI
jgi:Family of unknown function (DUF6678)